jgi:hypothetical protein
MSAHGRLNKVTKVREFYLDANGRREWCSFLSIKLAVGTISQRQNPTHRYVIYDDVGKVVFRFGVDLADRN